MNVFKFHARFENNKVIIIDCGSDSDMHTANRLHEDLIHLFPCEYHKAKDGAHFLALLGEIKLRCRNGLMPILHIGAHGHKDDGICIGNDGGFVSWKKLGEKLLQINKRTKNNLGVVLATCYGLHLINQADILKPCPFYFLIASEHEVECGVFDERMTPFYRAFKETSNITTAFEALESERGSKKLFQIFHSEKFFLLTFARQLRHMTTGKTGAMRIEGLLTQAMNGGVPNTREKRRELRTTFKTYIRKPEISYDSMTRIFLHGRKTASFEDVYRFVRADIESRRLDVVAQAQE